MHFNLSEHAEVIDVHKANPLLGVETRLTQTHGLLPGIDVMTFPNFENYIAVL